MTGSRPFKGPPVDEDWRKHASCLEHHPEDFFPVEKNHTTEARRICEQECIVAEECLTFAYEGREKDGVWAGVALFGKRMSKGAYRAQLKVLQER